MPDAFISTTTSRGPGVGSGKSRSSTVRSPGKTMPFISKTSRRLVCEGRMARMGRAVNVAPTWARNLERAYPPPRTPNPEPKSVGTHLQVRPTTSQRPLPRSRHTSNRQGGNGAASVVPGGGTTDRVSGDACSRPCYRGLGRRDGAPAHSVGTHLQVRPTTPRRPMPRSRHTSIRLSYEGCVVVGPGPCYDGPCFRRCMLEALLSRAWPSHRRGQT